MHTGSEYSSRSGFPTRIVAHTLTLEQPPSAVAHSTDQQYHVLKLVRLGEAGVPARPVRLTDVRGPAGLFCARCLFSAVRSSSPAANAAAAAVAAATTDTEPVRTTRKSHCKKPR